MKRRKENPDLIPAQKEAILEARNGSPYRLVRQINQMTETVNRLKGPTQDDPLGRWTIKMRDHYGKVLGLLKAAAKDCGIDLRKNYADSV